MIDSPHELPAAWATQRLDVRDATPADAAALTDIFNACAYVEPWDPTFHPVDRAELDRVIKRSLDGDEHANFRLQVLRALPDGAPIGYFHLFHGAPQPEVCWISMFVMQPEFQGQKLAGEVVDALAEQLAQAGYRAIWLHVYLRNWPALRFWTQHGFTTIVTYDGDKVMAEEAQARLRLERPLRD